MSIENGSNPQKDSVTSVIFQDEWTDSSVFYLKFPSFPHPFVSAFRCSAEDLLVNLQMSLTRFRLWVAAVYRGS